MKLFLLFFLLYAPSQANDNYTNYEGVANGDTIFLQLYGEYQKNMLQSASYFTDSNLNTSILSYEVRGDSLFLFGRTQESFSLLQLDQKLVGTFSKDYFENDDPLPITLQKSNRNFGTYKVSKIAYVKDSVTENNHVKFDWYSEINTKIPMCKISSGYPKKTIEFINSTLDSLHQGYITTYFACEHSELQVTVLFVSKKYISIECSSITECGGPHGDYDTYIYNFDVKNNKLLTKVTDVYPNLDVYNLLKENYGLDITLMEDCNYFNDEYVWNYYTWVFDENGIIVTPTFMHHSRPCEQGFFISYNELKQFATKQ